MTNAVVFALALAAGTPSLPAPEIFAPGIVSGPQNDGAPTFAPDGQALYFERSYGKRAIIFTAEKKDGQWQTPHVASFSGPWSDQQPTLSPDGQTLVYISSRRSKPAAGEAPHAISHIWRVTRTPNGWSAPSELPPEVNISNTVFRPTIAANGDLYFMSADSVGTDGPKWKLYHAAFLNGAYQKAEPLPFSGTGATDVDPYITPDRSFLIFSSSGRRTPDDGHEHLYIVLREGAGWGKVQPLRYAGDDWGGDDGEPQIDRAGETLYFTSSRVVPVDRSADRTTMLRDIERNEAWDNGVGNAWSLPFKALLQANGIVLPAVKT